jgi:predicted branched-subunit amino acid permease
MISWTAYRRDAMAGARAMTPWVLGIAPFGLVIGISAARVDVPTLAGWLTGPLIYAGSAQVATIQMLGAHAAPVAVVLTATVINLRLILYSAAMAAYWRGTPLWWRMLAGYLLVDPSFVVGTQGYAANPDPRRGHAHYLGAAAVLWISWLVAIAAGATAGGKLPDWLHLDFLIPLYLIGQIVSRLRQPRATRTVVAAGVVTLLCLVAPMHLGIAVGIVAGIAAGSLGRVPPAKAANGSTSSSAASIKDGQR